MRGQHLVSGIGFVEYSVTSIPIKISYIFLYFHTMRQKYKVNNIWTINMWNGQ